MIIALDGHSSCGKSTLAKDLARLLDYVHLDTGAMYRAVALYFQKHSVDINSNSAIVAALQNITIDFRKNGDHAHTYLNHLDVESEIRSLHIAQFVSEVSTLSEVRKHLVKQQREIGKKKCIVIDGRDIGTVVFPKAEVKIFLTASEEIRVERRFQELLKKNIITNREEVLENLRKRDFIDSNRDDSPLRKADDAILLDTTDMDRSQQLNKTVELIVKKLS